MYLVDDRGHLVWEDVRDPTMQANTDAIVRVDAMTRGTCLGTVEAIGPAVTTIEVGDRVLISSIRPGRLIDCSQAELVRVACADTSTCRVPEGVSDGEVLSLATFVGGCSSRSHSGRLKHEHVESADPVALAREP